VALRETPHRAWRSAKPLTAHMCRNRLPHSKVLNESFKTFEDLNDSFKTRQAAAGPRKRDRLRRRWRKRSLDPAGGSGREP